MIRPSCSIAWINTCFFLLEIYQIQGIGQHVAFVNHVVCATGSALDQKVAFINPPFLGPGGKFEEKQGQESSGETMGVLVGSEHPLENTNMCRCSKAAQLCVYCFITGRNESVQEISKFILQVSRD